MALRKREILNICQVLSEEKDLKVTIAEATKGFCLTGLGAGIGSVVAGPLGLFIGGSIASVAAAFMAQGKFKSVVEIIIDMTPQQKDRLVERIEKAIKSISVIDIIKLPMILKSTPLQELIIKELTLYLSNELNLVVC